MDVDPLADTVPPRHLYESDDEDEYDALPSASASSNAPTAEAHAVSVDLDSSHASQLATGAALTLVVAFGEAARVWASGAALGEQVGRVAVDATQAGLLFQPAWTRGAAYVLIAEAAPGARLPIGAMYPFAEAVVRELKPARLALLDTYAVPAYISTEHVPIWDAPVRFLGVHSALPADLRVQVFAPPNLLQSTSAAFLSLFSLPGQGQSASLLLLPSPHIAPPPPATLATSHFSAPPDTGEESVWDVETLRGVTRALLGAVGVEQGAVQWEEQDAGRTRKGTKGRRGDVGDGGMYI